MMKKTNQCLSFLLAMLLLVTGLPLAFAEDAPTSGSAGAAIAWTLDSAGLLAVSGSGDMDSYKRTSDVPWAKSAGKITRVVLGEGVTSVGGNNFSGCGNLESVTLPSTLKKIGDGAFNGCASLTEISLPAGLTDVGQFAFCECKKLKEMKFPNSVKTIGASALAACTYLADVTLPNTLEILDYQLFRMCHSLKTVKIPDTVKEICGGAFYNCVNLLELSVPKSVEKIGAFTFYGCRSLERVTVYNMNCEMPEIVNEVELKELHNTVFCSYDGSTTQAFAKEHDFKFEEMRYIPEHEHVWGKPQVTKPATCLETGIRTYTCTICDETLDEEIPITDHAPATVPAVAPTCKSTGLTEGVACSICGKVYTPQSVLPKTGHDWKETVTPATVGKNGKIVSTCTVCKATKRTKICKINSVKLSETEYIADNTAKKPTVTVKDSNNDKLKEGTDYTLKYSSGRKKVGIYTVTVTFKGNYTGTKTLKFKIIPGRVKNVKVKSAGGGKFTLTWNKVTGAKKYVVYRSTSENGEFTKVGNFTKNTVTTGGFTVGKVYYFKVRAVTNADGKNLFGAYSLTKHAKAKR